MVEKTGNDCCVKKKKRELTKIRGPRENSEDASRSAKIIIMGNSRVGKTCIIKAFMENASMKGRHIGHTNNIVQDF